MKKTESKPKAKATTKAKTTRKPKPIKPITKSKAEALCENLNPELRTQAMTLANAVITMQDKIEQQIPRYKTEPLDQPVTLGTGETVIRANPYVQEFRATVRDYSNALKNLKEILDEGKKAPSESAVDNLRKTFGVS